MAATPKGEELLPNFSTGSVTCPCLSHRNRLQSVALLTWICPPWALWHVGTLASRLHMYEVILDQSPWTCMYSVCLCVPTYVLHNLSPYRHPSLYDIIFYRSPAAVQSLVLVPQQPHALAQLQLRLPILNPHCPPVRLTSLHSPRFNGRDHLGGLPKLSLIYP